MDKEYLLIGEKMSVNGDVLFRPGYYTNSMDFGTIYKDENAFYNEPDEVCYIPEGCFDKESVVFVGKERWYQTLGWSRRDLEWLIDGSVDEDGDPIDIESFFNSLTWCYPDTKLCEIEFEL